MCRKETCFCSVTSTFKSRDICISVSNGSCDVLVHHLETVEGFTSTVLQAIC